LSFDRSVAAAGLGFASAWAARLLLGFAVGAVAPAETAVFAQFQTVRGFLLVLLRVVIAPLALRASHRNHNALLFLRHYPVSQDVDASAEHERNGRAARSRMMIAQGTRPVNSNRCRT
jgi:hypothetical protein